MKVWSILAGARRMTEVERVPGTHRGTLEELADRTGWAEKNLVY